MKKKDLENNEEYVECGTCGHIIAKKRAQIVKYDGGSWASYGFDVIRCELHKLPFDEVIFERYFRRMEVDGNGDPIG